MTIATDDSRLGFLEERITELSVAVTQLGERINGGLREVRQQIRNVNAGIDRLFLAILGIGAAQIALLVTLVIRTT